MHKKYELILNDFQYLDYIGEGSRKAFRIKALRDFGDVKTGDLGGFVASELNLSHDGNCWVYGEATVSEYGRVEGDAKVLERAHVCGNAKVLGIASIDGDAVVCGNAVIAEGTLGGYTRLEASAQTVSRKLSNRPPNP